MSIGKWFKKRKEWYFEIKQKDKSVRRMTIWVKKDIAGQDYFRGMNHYDNDGHKVGESRPGFFGSVKHYDNVGKKQGDSEPGLFGGFNHYDE